MTFDQYQQATAKTAIYPNRGDNFIYPTLGLAGEAGEVANKIKKVQRDHNGVITPEMRLALGKEIGDVLWYVSELCSELSLDLEAVAQHNLNRLAVRMAEGKLTGSGDNR